MAGYGSSDDIAELLEENKRLVRENKELTARRQQADQEADILERALKKERSITIRARVKAFHEKFDQPNRDEPTVPEPHEVLLRCRIVLEEATELVEACYPTLSSWAAAVRTSFMVNAESADSLPSLVKVADALADIDYVVEGTRLYFGIDGEPVMKLVHEANMAKVGGGKDSGGKIKKPEGWKPPDIEGEIRRQKGRP
jgi:predicted HAD superfamily Cof-like phosphohydrolase